MSNDKLQMTNKKKYVIGNWKSNKTISQAKKWLDKFSYKLQTTNYETNNLEVVVCPSFIHLPLFRTYIDQHSLPLELGVQNISSFEQGAYTGEIAASMIKNIVSYTLVGHSERRAHFHESDEFLAKKVIQAKSNGIEPIFCVQDEKTSIPDSVSIVAYEPVWAIGTGKSDSPENADAVCSHIRENSNATIIVYGGSVKPDNVSSLLQSAHIDGVLVGGASLDSGSFGTIIQNA